MNLIDKGIECLNRKAYKKKILFSYLGRKIDLLYRWYSLNYRLKKRAAKILYEKVAPEWVSEAYILFFFTAIIILYAISIILYYWSSPKYLFIPLGIILVIAVYRIPETCIFFIHWVFVEKEPIWSYRRRRRFCQNRRRLCTVRGREGQG